VLTQNASGVPRAIASNISSATFDVNLLAANGTPLPDPAGHPTLDPATGVFSGPIPPTDGFRVSLGAFVPELVKQAGDVTVTIDSITPGNPVVDEPATYYLTKTGPTGTESLVIPLAIGYTDGGLEHTASASFTVLQADTAFGRVFNTDPTKVTLPGSVELAAPDNWYLSGPGRGWANGHSASAVGPRVWVAGQAEPGDPNAGNGYGFDASAAARDPDGTWARVAGEISGYDILAPKAYLTTTSRMRSLEAVLSTVKRAADIEVTWGANGAVTVQDLTHGVPIPFNEAYRASYGFLNAASFAGVTASRDGNTGTITPSDWDCVAPHNQNQIDGNVEFLNCASPVPARLQQTAAITPIDTSYAGRAGSNAGPGTFTTARPGFALYLAGEVYFFFPANGQLPAAGTRWMFRHYAGYIQADPVGDPVTDYTNYVFDSDNATDGIQLPVRPPNVPGLRAQIALTATEVVADANLDAVHTVPDPYYVTNKLENTSAEKRMQFVGLPNKAVIRIYSLSGILLQVLSHDDETGGGTLDWDLRTRNNQFIASGVYFFHVETPDGKTKVGKFTVVQFAQ
jgi:hypothetical protein